MILNNKTPERERPVLLRVFLYWNESVFEIQRCNIYAALAPTAAGSVVGAVRIPNHLCSVCGQISDTAFDRERERVFALEHFRPVVIIAGTDEKVILALFVNHKGRLCRSAKGTGGLRDCRPAGWSSPYSKGPTFRLREEP